LPERIHFTRTETWNSFLDLPGLFVAELRHDGTVAAVDLAEGVNAHHVVVLDRGHGTGLAQEAGAGIGVGTHPI
jgi:hypothetical protein